MIIEGDCLSVMSAMADNSISCIVTDPPYGLGFMGKKWDAGLPHDEIWKEALRVVRPGGHILAFGGTRTYHRLTCAIEDAGWEIRDCVYWLYGSGFPKSHNHFGLEGYGTALKPAVEPCVMAMKPLDGTFAQNAEKWGQAGINIDECRVDCEPWKAHYATGLGTVKYFTHGETPIIHKEPHSKGRWPANVIFDEEAGKLLNEQSGCVKASKPKEGGQYRENPIQGAIDWKVRCKSTYPTIRGDSGGASRFFYCPKASSSERNEGLEGLEDKGQTTYGVMRGNEIHSPNRSNSTKNNHPTVKPLKLMEYLIKLVMPPKDGVLLDPFAGSGSTIVAAHRLGFKAIGIEKQPEYCEIARARLENCMKEEPKTQLDLFTKTA